MYTKSVSVFGRLGEYLSHMNKALGLLPSTTASACDPSMPEVKSGRSDQKFKIILST